MAFTTIPGSGAAATSIVGTSGVDFGSITSVDSFFVGAQQGADTIGVTANLSNGTIKGGQGADNLQFTAGASITTSFVNTNSNNDTIGAAGATANFFTSTVLGGQGTDTFTLGSVNQSKVNGNKDDDTFAAGGVLNAATIFGGQGNDTVNAVTSASSSLLSGDLGNDRLTMGGGDFTSTSVNGGDGNDNISIQASTAATNIFTNNTINGGDGADNINGSAVRATSSGTVVNGDAGVDTINFTTFTQAVTISGGADGDIINTGTAADTVRGDAGIDNITNNGGTDTITGGTGADNITLTTTLAAVNEVVVQGVGDSVAATVGFNAATLGAAGAGSTTITFGNGVDVIAGGLNAAQVGDTFQTGIAGGTVLINTNALTARAAGNYIMRGAFAAGVFTQADAGADVLFLQTSGGDLRTAANNGTSSLVISNVGALTDVQLQGMIVV